MNINALGYLIYLMMTGVIIYGVGKRFHQRGRIFILELHQGDEKPADALNNMLLAAYYLFNIGYAFERIRHWVILPDYPSLIATVGRHIGILIIVLAITHYGNMLLIYVFSKRQKLTTHPKY